MMRTFLNRHPEKWPETGVTVLIFSCFEVFWTPSPYFLSISWGDGHFVEVW